MRFVERIINILFPPKCIFCGCLLEPGHQFDICGDCYDKIPFVEEIPLQTKTSHDGYDSVICVSCYAGIMKDSLIRFKFYSKPGYYRTFARLLSIRIGKAGGVMKFDMVMSVPLHKQKEFFRGYNQAYLISKSLGKELQLPECSHLLVRHRNTNAQSLLDKEKRQRNIRGAFRVTEPGRIEGKSILLVDDILTTGYTANECGLMLKNAGAKSVTVAVVATAVKY